MRKRKPHLQITPELLRSTASREAPYIGQYGWRPTQKDLTQLRASTRDAIAYRILARAWRTAGFRVRAIRKIAGRAPADRNATIRHFAAGQ
jgi:hypothetical protein